MSSGLLFFQLTNFLSFHQANQSNHKQKSKSVFPFQILRKNLQVVQEDVVFLGGGDHGVVPKDPRPIWPPHLTTGF